MRNAVGSVQNILLLGGTSEIGLAIVAALLKEGPAHVTLAARVSQDHPNEAIAAVEEAGASSVDVIDFDATAFDTHPEVIEKAFSKGDVDVAIVAFGSLGDQERLWQDQAAAVASAELNYTAAVSVGVLLGQYMKEQGHGTIVAMSSVAGQRVRRSNFVYGASKAGLDAFYVNLHEALRDSGVQVVVVRPGQVRTKMTAGLEDAPLTVDKEDIGEAVVDAIANNRNNIFVHPLFRYISLAFKFIPQSIFRRLPM